MTTSLRILMLTPQVPYPPHQGTSLRNYHIIRGLARHHEVTLLTLVEASQQTDEAAIRPLLDNLVSLHTIPAPTRSTRQRLHQLLTTRLPDMAHRLFDPAFASALHQLLQTNTFDLVQIEGIELARYLDGIRVGSKNTKTIFDNHNAETELQRRSLLTDLGQPRRWLAAAYSLVQVGRLRRFERWACQQADGVVAVSATDAALLRPFRGQRQPPIAIIPNSIDIASYQAPVVDNAQTKYDLVFTGKMDYRPNVDAVLWFANKIWPRIRAVHPETTCAIVGQKPHARLDRLRDEPGITITGWVEAVQPYLTQAAVVVMPFRVGSGTRLKIIESMAAGKAIVSTAIGAEGFPVTSGQELMVADEPAQFAEAVVALLADPVKRNRLGETAVAFAARYDWRNVIPAFELLYNAVFEKTDLD